MTAIYFLCDTAAAGYAAAVNTCRSEHEKNAPGTRLSVSVDPSGTRAVIKVARGAAGLINAPAVIQAYTSAEHDQLKADMAAIAPLDQWSNPA